MSFLPRWRLRGSAEDARTVYVSEKFGVRSLHIGSDTVQSAMRLARPHDLELSYTRSMMAFLLFNAAPRTVLIIGLGGGSVAKFIYHHMPQAQIRVVEIDPQVLTVARQSFLVPPDDARFRITVSDGAAHMAQSGGAADVILVDGYDADSHVAELATPEFYRHCRARLAPGGVLVINLWGSDRQFNDILQRIESEFPDSTLCLPARKPGNVIALAFRDTPGPLRWEELNRRAAELAALYGLEFPLFVAGLRTMNRHDEAGVYP